MPDPQGSAVTTPPQEAVAGSTGGHAEMRQGVDMLQGLKRASLPLGVLAVGIAIIAVLIGLRPKPEAAAELPRPGRVHIATAERVVTQLRVDTYGEVRPTIQTDVVAQVAGRVVGVSREFVEGGRFEAGEVLLSVEDTDYLSALTEAEARQAAASVDLETALADADVARQQLKGVKNPSPLALKEPQVARAEAALAAAEAVLSLAKTNLARTQIALPFRGRLSSTSVDLGQYVTPGKVVARAFGTDRVEIRLPLTDTQLAALGVAIGYTAGSSAGLAVDLSAQVAGEHYRWSGRVTRLDASIDPTTRVIYATAEVENPYPEPGAMQAMPLAVGLFVDAQIAGRIVENVISIPEAGLRAGDRVFILNEEGLLEIRQANVIHRGGNEAILASGVAVNEAVIVSAIRNPIPGMRLEAIDTLSSDVGGSDTLAN
jgi:RND family efflux transporter MFP subunit